MVDSGESVVGIDSFTTYYDPAVKRRNIERLNHLAAQPGVRRSWGREFDLLKEGLSEQIAGRTSLWPGAGPG